MIGIMLSAAVNSLMSIATSIGGGRWRQIGLPLVAAPAGGPILVLLLNY